MKAKEIIWKEVSVLPHSANAYPKGKPYKGQMMMGRASPVSTAQAMAFVEQRRCIPERNSEDVSIVETLLVKHHLEGKYRYVGDKSFVKLINQSDLDRALKTEYAF